jgi:hypothetical protein
MSAPKKTKSKSKGGAKAKARVPQASGWVIGVSGLSIGFLLVADFYYLWQLLQV